VAVMDERLDLRLAVPVEHLVAHEQGIARYADEPLDVVLVRFVRWEEDDDVAEPRFVEGGQPNPRAGDLGAVDGLVDQQEVTDEQGVLHAPSRDAERLDEEGPDEEEQTERDENGLDPLPSPPAGRHRGTCPRDCPLLSFRQPVRGGPVDLMPNGGSSEFTSEGPPTRSARLWGNSRPRAPGGPRASGRPPALPRGSARKGVPRDRVHRA